jgi:Protein of unknown function (DUF998)
MMTTRGGDRLTRWLLAGGVVGPLSFIVVFLIEGAIRPGYSVWRNNVSELALSDQGWEQIANLLVCGTLCIGFAVGLRRTWRRGRASVWGHPADADHPRLVLDCDDRPPTAASANARIYARLLMDYEPGELGEDLDPEGEVEAFSYRQRPDSSSKLTSRRLPWPTRSAGRSCVEISGGKAGG